MMMWRLKPTDAGRRSIAQRLALRVPIATGVSAVCFLIVVGFASEVRAQAIPQTGVGLRAELAYGTLAPRETLALTGTLDDTLRSRLRRPPLHDPWFSFDKVQHFTFSALFTVGGQYVLVNKAGWGERSALPVSALTSFTIGLTKELHDWQVGPRRYFSWRDMAANGAGIAVAAGFILL